MLNMAKLAATDNFCCFLVFGSLLSQELRRKKKNRCIILKRQEHDWQVGSGPQASSSQFSEQKIHSQSFFPHETGLTGGFLYNPKSVGWL